MRPAAVLLAALLLACGAPAKPRSQAAALPRARVSVGMHVIDAEVADTPERKAQGLSDRPSLGPDQGMLFPYDAPGRPRFWMHGMRFDLDFAWISGGRLAELSTDVPHPHGPDAPVILQPKEPIDAVLEVPAGTAARLGWQVGDPVHVERLP